MNSKQIHELGARRQYKGKCLIMYESIFKGDDIITLNPNFWNELFLMKPAVTYIENEVSRLNAESLSRCKRNINSLVSHCISALGDESLYRIVYSLQTLSALLLSLYKKANVGDRIFDLIDILFGYQYVNQKMSEFIQYSEIFLSGEYSTSIKTMVIKVFLIMVTGMDNINQNTLLDYVMSGSIFESLMKLLINTTSRNEYGYNIVLILTLLVNYRKHEVSNPFIVKLSILDDELALNGYGQVISASLLAFCKQFTQLKSDFQVSWITSLTSIIGTMFLSEEETKSQQIRENYTLLLALYEATHLNRNFVTTLAYTQSDVSSLTCSASILSYNQVTVGSQIIDNASQPFNLLAIFFQYCSIVIQATGSETIMHNIKLCFLILSCISEDQYANSLMHDANLAFRVQLHKLTLHRRKNNTPTTCSQPLAATLLDIIVEFLASHLLKKFPLELYQQCISILLKILCYQKRCRVRLNYRWITLWTALINLLKFLTSHESYLAKKMNIHSLASGVVNILNIFITYGDMFLLSPHTYDELFYEIIRMKLIFFNLNTMGIRYSNIDTYEYKESAVKLNNALVNIRDILNHFPPKITEWLNIKSISTPSQSQIMEVIIKNYDSLTLKLQDNLDQFERYTEIPQHCEFFNNLVRNVIAVARTSIEINLVDAAGVLQDQCYN